MFTIRKSFLVGAAVFFISNLLMGMAELFVIGIALDFVVPFNYDPLHFLNCAYLIAFSGLCFGNILIIKSGVYETVNRHF